MVQVQVKDVMITNIIKVKECDSVKDVLEKMTEYRVGGLPIVNEKNELTGYISDGDIMRWIGNYAPLIINNFYYQGVFYDTENVEQKVDRLLSKNIHDLSQKKVIFVHEDLEIGQVAKI